MQHAADDKSDEKRNEAPRSLAATHPGIFQSIRVSSEFIRLKTTQDKSLVDYLPLHEKQHTCLQG